MFYQVSSDQGNLDIDQFHILGTLGSDWLSTFSNFNLLIVTHFSLFYVLCSLSSFEYYTRIVGPVGERTCLSLIVFCEIFVCIRHSCTVALRLTYCWCRVLFAVSGQEGAFWLLLVHSSRCGSPGLSKFHLVTEILHAQNSAFNYWMRSLDEQFNPFFFFYFYFSLIYWKKINK